MSASNYLENKLLDHVVGKTSYTMPSVWIALFTADPGEAGSFANEATYTGYARKATTGTDWNAASGGTITNAATLTFANCTAGSNLITYAATVDSATTGAGNVLLSGALTSSVTINTTNFQPQFLAGDLSFTCD